MTLPRDANLTPTAQIFLRNSFTLYFKLLEFVVSQPPAPDFYTHSSPLFMTPSCT